MKSSRFVISLLDFEKVYRLSAAFYELALDLVLSGWYWERMHWKELDPFGSVENGNPDGVGRLTQEHPIRTRISNLDMHKRPNHV
jgi:hypothetical protein